MNFFRVSLLTVRAKLFAAVLIAIAISPNAIAEQAPRVVVTMKPVHALVTRVMQGVGAPVLLVDGSSSPHSFALKPSGARAVHEADVFIRVGAEVEPFTVRLMDSLPATVTAITLIEAPGIQVLGRRLSTTFEAHSHEQLGHMDDDDEDPAHAHDHGHDHAHSSRDGHIWLDPENAKAIVSHVVKVLSLRWPNHAGRFAANGTELSKQIDALSAEIAGLVAPLKGRPFVVFHDAYQYFERRFGLAAAGALTISPEVPPGARRLTQIRQRISQLGAVCVFAEPHLSSKVIDTATEGTKTRAGILDPEAVGLQPGGELYFVLMRNMAQGFRECLNGGA